MRVAWASVLAVLAILSVPAGAEPSATSFEAPAVSGGAAEAHDAPAPGGPRPAGAGRAARRAEATGARFAFGVSSPTGWLRGGFGASLYAGVDDHHAIRANVARFDADELLPLVVAGGERAPRTGYTLDLGLGWTWYPRRLWDGPTLELGALRRERDVRVHSELDHKDTTRSVTHGGRAMVGWSWLITRRWFLAIAAGLSAGHESGQQTIVSATKMSTHTLDRLQVDAEIYMRIGLAYGR